ncbi:hypothetical protein E3P98_02937 [Wallemia ichthyophaga]|nr:hypothetical protein E3P98_02937 [Wallemia ichthyophaga]
MSSTRDGLRESINRGCDVGVIGSSSSSTSNRATPTKPKIKLTLDPFFFAPKNGSKKRKQGDDVGEVGDLGDLNKLRDPNDTNDAAQRSYLDSTRRALTPHAYLTRTRLKHFGGQLSAHAMDMCGAYVGSFRSSDTVHFPSRLSTRTYAPPLTTAFIPSTRSTPNPILAVGDEEGGVTMVGVGADASQPQPQSQQSHSHSTVGCFDAHDNAIFDLSFSRDSLLFATASADQETRVWDTATQTHTATCHGHTGSIKSLAWSPFSTPILASAARDGSIRIWDARTRCRGASAVVSEARNAHDSHDPSELDSLLTIDRAHASLSEQRKRSSIGRSITRSVTSITFLHTRDNTLASAGSANGSVKLWDVRGASSSCRQTTGSGADTSTQSKQSKQSKQAKVKNRPLAETPDMTQSDSGSGSRRPHGVAHMVSDGQWLWTLCTNSIIYGYPANNLDSKVDAPIQLSDPDMQCASFWVRLAISPDARYLSCGSTNGKVFSWDIANSKRMKRSQGKAIHFTHARQDLLSQLNQPASAEVGSLDWADDVLATCSDDMTVRLWRPRP